MSFSVARAWISAVFRGVVFNVASGAAAAQNSNIADSLQFSSFFSNILNGATGVNFMTLVRLILGWLVFAWILVVIWVYKDASLRYDNFMMPLFWAVVVLPFNVLGLIAYVAMRPTEYTLNSQQLELDVLSSKAYLTGFVVCHNCDSVSVRDVKNKYCYKCGAQLVFDCQNCNSPVWVDFSFCQVCGTPVSAEGFVPSTKMQTQQKQQVTQQANLPAEQAAKRATERAMEAKQVAPEPNRPAAHVKDSTSSVAGQIIDKVSRAGGFVLDTVDMFADILYDMVTYPFVVAAKGSKAFVRFVTRPFSGKSKKNKGKQRKHEGRTKESIAAKSDNSRKRK